MGGRSLAARSLTALLLVAFAAFLALPHQAEAQTPIELDVKTSVEVGESNQAFVGIVLKSQPTSDVVVDVVNNDPGVFTVTPASFTFTPETWDEQEADITPVQDADTTDDTGTFTLSGTGVTTVTVTVTVIDDDLLLTLPSSPVTLTEETTTTFQVVLASAPVQDRTVTVDSLDPGAVTTQPPSLDFTDENWNVPQEVTVTGVADGDKFDELVTITLYGPGVTNATVTVHVVDDVLLTLPQSPVTLNEEATATFQVVLASMPVQDRTVTLESLDLGAVTIHPASLNFTPLNWNAPRTVTLTGVADGDQTNEMVTITLYGPGVTNGTVTVLVMDNDPPPTNVGGGGGGGGFAFSGGGGRSGPSPSKADFEWTVTRDIDALDPGNTNVTGLWSDHTTLWIAENPDGPGDSVYAYDLASDERVDERELQLDETNRAPRGLWSDGHTIWVSDSGRERLFAYDLASSDRLADRDLTLASRNVDARGIWSDGAVMWVLDGVKNALFAYDLATGDSLAEYTLAFANGDPHGLWSDGVALWVSDDGAKQLFAYRLPVLDAEEPTQGEDEADEVKALKRLRDEEFDKLSRASNNSPRGIWSDGDVIYVVDASDGKVYTYNMPDAIDARLATLNLSGVDSGEFDGRRTDYEGVPGEGVTETTIEATTVQRRTDVAFDPPDADGEADGHQVSLQGVEEITVTVTSADGSRTRVYRVTIQRPEVELELAPPWTSIVWPGADGITIADALRDDGIADKVVVVYHWDEATAAWFAFFPGLGEVPGLNTLTTFTAGGTYWMAVAEPLTWAVATP